MEIKAGSIYKVIHNGNTYVGIAIGKEETYNKQEKFIFITITGNSLQVVPNESTTFSATRLKAEVRDALKDLYKQHQEKIKIEQQIKALETKLRKKNDDMEKKKEKIKLISDEFEMNDFTKKFYDIRSYSNDPKNPRFSFYIDVEIAKYANPEEYPFLYREYDNNIFIADDKSCIKKYGLKIDKKDVEQLKKKLKYTVLKGISDGCEMGDKDRLYVNKILEFSIKKGVKYSEILKEGKIIKNWVEKQKEKLGA